MTPETILLVDNDAAIRKVVRVVLQQLGYEVLEAASDSEAIDTVCAPGVSVDLLLTDIGAESAGCLKHLRPEMKVLCISSCPTDAPEKSGIDTPYPVISKPLKPHTLARTIREVLDRQEIGRRCTPSHSPLPRQLNGLDPGHSFLAEQGITTQTAKHFGAGFFRGPGTLAGRVVAPISNGEGELIGYASHSIDGSEPKFRYWPEFNKSEVLFNFKPARCLASDFALSVILVDGFLECMKVHQAGYPSVVSLTGPSLSGPQEQLLTDSFYQIVLFTNRPELSSRLAARLIRKSFIKVLADPAGRPPNQLLPDDIAALMCNVTEYGHAGTG